MGIRERSKIEQGYQIEELLLNAQIEQEIGLDLIEEYFQGSSSLDEVTNRAKEMLNEHTDPKIIETIGKNLSECIVVRSQQEQRSLLGLARRVLAQSGIISSKSGEILRAEELFQMITKALSKAKNETTS